MFITQVTEIWISIANMIIERTNLIMSDPYWSAPCQPYLPVNQYQGQTDERYSLFCQKAQ